ncbi:MAG: response regulator [Elusimicrobiota bacterium]
MKKKILVIESEDIIAAVLRDSLQNTGYDVAMANSGIEGLRRAIQEIPNVIILDIMMPGLDGIQVLKELKAEKTTKEIPVIIMSVTSDKYRNEVLKLGAVGFFKKPLDFKQLNDKIRTVTEKKTVMVVEDNPEILRLLHVRLQSMGYDVIGAEDGPTAIERAKKTKPDVILMDIVLPREDGFEITRQLKKDEELEKIPVIAFSGYFADGIDKKKVLGVDRFLNKEFSAEDLVEEVKYFLDEENKNS